MASTRAPRVLALLVNFTDEVESYADNRRALTITGTVVTINKSGTPLEIRNASPSSYGDETRSAAYYDFQVGARAVSDGSLGKDAGSYAWETVYRSPYQVDIWRADLMLKTLRTIERGMRKLADQEGQPLTFGQYLNRVARIIGAKRVIFRFHDEKGIDRRDTSNGWNYDSAERSGAYYTENLGDAADRIDYRIRTWTYEHRPRTQEALPAPSYQTVS